MQTRIHVQNMRSRFPVALAISMALFVVASAPAQTGSFTIFGKGCIGSGAVSCPSNDANATTLANIGQDSRLYAILVPAQRRAMMVDGFEFFTKASSGFQATIVTQLNLARAGGAPGSVVASGTMTIGRSLGWYKTKFQKPVLVPPNTRLFIAYRKSTGQMYFPVTPYAPSRLATHYVFRSFGGWLGPITNVVWAYKLNCRQAPEIGNIGVPAIGKTHTLTLAGARPNAQAILAIGTKRLNPAFPWPGAPSCYLLIDSPVLFFLKTDSLGSVRVPEPVPNDPKLIGLKFPQQFAVVDPTNAAGLVFSAGGEVTL